MLGYPPNRVAYLFKFLYKENVKKPHQEKQISTSKKHKKSARIIPAGFFYKKLSPQNIDIFFLCDITRVCLKNAIKASDYIARKLLFKPKTAILSRFNPLDNSYYIFSLHRKFILSVLCVSIHRFCIISSVFLFRKLRELPSNPRLLNY